MSINDVVNKEWFSDFMNSNKIQAKKLISFDKNKYLNKNLDIENNSSTLEELHSLKSLSNFLSEEDDSFPFYIKKLRDVDETIAHINKNYDNAFQNYLESVIDSSNERIHDYVTFQDISFQVSHLRCIEFDINKLSSDIALYRLKNKKVSLPKLKKVNEDYLDLLSRIKTAKEIMNSESMRVEKLELLQLKLLSGLRDVILDYQNRMKKKMKFSRITKIAAIITIAAALYNIGSVVYKKSPEFSNFVDNIKTEYVVPTKTNLNNN